MFLPGISAKNIILHIGVFVQWVLFSLVLTVYFQLPCLEELLRAREKDVLLSLLPWFSCLGTLGYQPLWSCWPLILCLRHVKVCRVHLALSRLVQALALDCW